MGDPLRHVVVDMGEGWAATAPASAAPDVLHLSRLGISAASEWEGHHDGDGSRLTVWSLRAQPAAVDELVQSLRRRAHAEQVGSLWVWAAHTPGWLSFCALQPSADVEGPPLLWSSHLPLETAAARLREILASTRGAAWRWNEMPTWVR